MIEKERKDLIDRRALYKKIVKKMNEQGGATLNSALTFWELMEILEEIPVENESNIGEN